MNACTIASIALPVMVLVAGYLLYKLIKTEAMLSQVLDELEASTRLLILAQEHLEKNHKKQVH